MRATPAIRNAPSAPGQPSHQKPRSAGKTKLTTTAIVPNPPTRVLPVVSHEGRDYVVMMRLISVLPTRHLRQPVGSIAQYRADITRALDWLFFGI